MVDFKSIDDRIAEASRNHPHLAPLLQDVNLRVVVEKDRVHVLRTGDGSPLVFPLVVYSMNQGFYYSEHDDQGKILRLARIDGDGKVYAAQDDPVSRKIIYVDPDTSARLDEPMNTGIPLGFHAYERKRAGSKAVFWATLTVLPKPKSSGPPPDIFPLRYYEEVFNVPALLRLPGWVTEAAVVAGPGMGDTRFEVGGYYEDPLLFTYHAQNGYHALVSREMVGQDFYYKVPLFDIQQFQQAWVYRTVAKNTAGMAIVSQVIVEIAVSFLPIVGPLYNLCQTGLNVYSASQNWGKMKGWEKALVGLDVLLTAVTGFPKVARAGKGLLKYEQGVKALETAGVSSDEARTLMKGAAVFQDLPATRTVVETLVAKVESGGALTAKELAQVENIAEEMLKRLPPAERQLQAARFAMRDLNTAREFMKGLDVSEEMFNAMKNLSPEVLVQVRALVKEERLTLATLVTTWSRETAVATGINSLVGSVRPAHLTEIAVAVGEDTLRKLGSGEIHIAPQLATLVSKESGSGKAYTRLMQQPLLGLNDQMFHIRAAAGPLDAKLSAIQEKIRHVYLSEEHLLGLSRVGDDVHELLKAAPDSQVKQIASIAARSSDAAASIDKIVASFAGKAKGGVLPGVIERLGVGLLEAMERQGITLSADLLKKAATKTGATDAVRVLMEGVAATRSAKAVEGLFDQLVKKMGSNEKLLMDVLSRITHKTNRAEVFARWAVANPTIIPGIEEVLKLRPNDAQLRIMRIYRDFKDPAARAIFEEIAWIEKAASPEGLDLLIADLGGGFEKAMGASLILDFASKKVTLSSIKGFEQIEENGAGVARQYDLVAGDVFYEFKYWQGYGGKSVEAAAEEFVRDALLHAPTGFKNLRWVFSNDVKPYLPVIAERLLDELGTAKSVAMLEKAGLEVEDVKQAFLEAAKPPGGWLFDFQ